MTSNESQQSNKYRRKSLADNQQLEASVVVSEGPEEAFVDTSLPPVPTARRNSTKSVKSLSKNKVFPQKLPPIRKNVKNKDIKKMSKIKSGKIACYLKG